MSHSALVLRGLRAFGRVVGLAFVVAAMCTPAWAIDWPTPELDPGSVAGAITLLSSGLLLIGRSRRPRSAN